MSAILDVYIESHHIEGTSMSAPQKGQSPGPNLDPVEPTDSAGDAGKAFRMRDSMVVRSL